MITHQLPLPQPWAWALIAGEIEVANCDYPPPPSLLGKRIGIVGGPLWECWWLLEGLGIGLRRQADRTLAPICYQRGWLGTAELVGYLEVAPGRKVTGQVRPGDETPFRTRKGVLGPMSWILRRPKVGDGVSGARTLRAFWEESSAYREHLSCYATSAGRAGLSSQHLETLAKMGTGVPLKETPK